LVERAADALDRPACSFKRFFHQTEGKRDQVGFAGRKFDGTTFNKPTKRSLDSLPNDQMRSETAAEMSVRVALFRIA
jgi:hypothetical protein